MSPKQSSPEYEPSQALKDAKAAMDAAAEEAERKRHAYRKAIAEELASSGLSQAKLAEHTPYTEPTVRGIAIEYGIAAKRKPTVRSIRDDKSS